ncbi:MAG: PrsW family intramembrane metalloprotease [Microbacteriaceae bacterium]
MMVAPQVAAHASPAMGGAPNDVRAEAADGTAPFLAGPVRRSASLIISGVIGLSILSVLALIVIVYLIAGLGPSAFAVGGILALVPLAIVLLGVNWIDRWEPEPRGILIFGFLWGSTASVLATLIVGAELESIVGALAGSSVNAEFFGAAIQAPVVEELAKGLGLLLIFWFAHKHFDGPLDGLVYGAWVAGGFAFTENILYFGSELLDSGSAGSVAQLFLIRGLMSPFAHVMFTACTGLALGIAARRTGKLGVLGFFVLGIIPAIALHALWNGALFFVDDFYVYYAVVQFPLFVLGVLIVLFMRRQESELTRMRLTEYAKAGWFSPGEIDALSTGAGRRLSQEWAKTYGVKRLMRDYTRDATKLAFTRQRLVTGRASVGAEADEAALLASIVASRHALHAVVNDSANNPVESKK